MVAFHFANPKKTTTWEGTTIPPWYHEQVQAQVPYGAHRLHLLPIGRRATVPVGVPAAAPLAAEVGALRRVRPPLLGEKGRDSHFVKLSAVEFVPES